MEKYKIKKTDINFYFLTESNVKFNLKGTREKNCN